LSGKSSSDLQERSFQGYLRPNGTVGVRNLVAVIYTVDCARIVSQKIADSIPNGISVGWFSCYSTEDINDINTLVGIGSNPNIGSAIVVGLGCQHISPFDVATEIRKTGKPAESLSIQGSGGTKKTVEQGIKIAKKMSAELGTIKRTESSLSNLMIGVNVDGGGQASQRLLNLFGSISRGLVDGGSRVLTNHGIAKSSYFRNGQIQSEIVRPGQVPRSSGIYEVDGMVARSIENYGLENDGVFTDFAAAGAQIMMRGTRDVFGIGNEISPTINIRVGDSSKFGQEDFDVVINNFRTVSITLSNKWKSKILQVLADVADGKKTRSEAIGQANGTSIIGGRALIRMPNQVCE
jgi:altronate dehydratase